MTKPTLIYKFGPFCLDSGSRTLTKEGKTIALTPIPTSVLLALVKRPGRLVTKHQLRTEVWPETYTGDNDIQQQISLLRRALGEGPCGNKYIETVRHQGYRFVAKVTDIEPSEQPSAQEPCWQNYYCMPPLKAIVKLLRDEGAQIVDGTVWHGNPSDEQVSEFRGLLCSELSLINEFERLAKQYCTAQLTRRGLSVGIVQFAFRHFALFANWAGRWYDGSSMSIEIMAKISDCVMSMIYTDSRLDCWPKRGEVCGKALSEVKRLCTKLIRKTDAELRPFVTMSYDDLGRELLAEPESESPATAKGARETDTKDLRSAPAGCRALATKEANSKGIDLDALERPTRQ
jgi:DNA-binding winged helix-turn-helix (wHTH) protein